MRRIACVMCLLVVLMVSGSCGSGSGPGDVILAQQFFAFVAAIFYQYDFVNVGPPTLNSSNTDHGGVLYQLNLPAGNYFLNTTLQTPGGPQWQVRNLPVTTPGGNFQFYVAIDLGGFQLNPNQDVPQVDQVSTLSHIPLLDTTLDFTTVLVFDETLTFQSGKDDGNIVPAPAPVIIAPPNGMKYTLVYDGVTFDVDTAGHSTFTNQDAGTGECTPTAVSNSLKTIGVGSAAENSIATAINLVGFNGVCSPQRWDIMKAAGTSGGNYNLNTTQLDPKGDTAAQRIAKICQAKDALANGSDVEIDSPSHTAMVTRITKTTSGGVTKYYIFVAHDTNQGPNTTGTKQEVMEYDPATNMFSGAKWFDGNICDQIIIETKK